MKKNWNMKQWNGSFEYTKSDPVFQRSHSWNYS